MILVVGATGSVGSEVCRRLRGRGRSVRALVRPGSPREAALAGLGVEIAQGDLKDAVSLERACTGATAVVTTATSTLSRRSGDGLKTVDRDGNLRLVEAARRARVGHFVHVSLSPSLPEDNPLVAYKREVEGAVRRSGIAWTVLQPSCFMEIWFGPNLGWDLARGRATLFGSGEAPVSYVSLGDVAEFAVVSLERPEARNRNLPLGGPEAVRPLDAVRVFEEVTGRRFKVKRMPLFVVGALRRIVAPFDPVRSALMGLGQAVGARGDVIDMAPVLRDFSVPLTSLRDYAVRASAQSAGH